VLDFSKEQGEEGSNEEESNEEESNEEESNGEGSNEEEKKATECSRAQRDECEYYFLLSQLLPLLFLAHAGAGTQPPLFTVHIPMSGTTSAHPGPEPSRLCTPAEPTIATVRLRWPPLSIVLAPLPFYSI